MSLRTAIIKRNLRKNASLLDTVALEHAFERIDEVIEASHLEKEEALKTAAEAYTKEVEARLSALAQRLSGNLEGVTSEAQNDLRAVADSAKEAINSEKSGLSSFIESLRAEAHRLSDGFAAKCDALARNIETMRGPKGDKGDNGKDGSPDTGTDIAKKLNKTEQTVNMSVIRGLEEAFNTMTRNIKQVASMKRSAGGGGGMGDPQHETFSVGSATTSITLAYNVAARGNAIWLYYQGQFMLKGTHYTVSGKTVTLLFTPVDSTNVDVTYIRT